MLLRRKNVLCSNCGFLGWVKHSPVGESTRDWQDECHPRIRTGFQTGELNGEMEDYENWGVYSLSCYRMQWTLTLGPDNEDRNLLCPNTTRQLRQCRYYIKYHPGYTPGEHKELVREATMRRTVMKATLLGASVGALAAIIANLLFNS